MVVLLNEYQVCRQFYYIVAALLVLLAAATIISWMFHLLQEIEGLGSTLFKSIQDELSILGAISFILFAVQMGIQASRGKDDQWLLNMIHLVEYTHLLIFIIAVAYIVQCGWLVVVRHRMRVKWAVRARVLRQMTPRQLELLDDLPRLWSRRHAGSTFSLAVISICHIVPLCKTLRLRSLHAVHCALARQFGRTPLLEMQLGELSFLAHARNAPCPSSSHASSSLSDGRAATEEEEEMDGLHQTSSLSQAPSLPAGPRPNEEANAALADPPGSPPPSPPPAEAEAQAVTAEPEGEVIREAIESVSISLHDVRPKAMDQRRPHWGRATTSTATHSSLYPELSELSGGAFADPQALGLPADFDIVRHLTNRADWNPFPVPSLYLPCTFSQVRHLTNRADWSLERIAKPQLLAWISALAVYVMSYAVAEASDEGDLCNRTVATIDAKAATTGGGFEMVAFSATLLCATLILTTVHTSMLPVFRLSQQPTAVLMGDDGSATHAAASRRNRTRRRHPQEDTMKGLNTTPRCRDMVVGPVHSELSGFMSIFACFKAARAAGATGAHARAFFLRAPCLAMFFFQVQILASSIHLGFAWLTLIWDDQIELWLRIVATCVPTLEYALIFAPLALPLLTESLSIGPVSGIAESVHTAIAQHAERRQTCEDHEREDELRPACGLLPFVSCTCCRSLSQMAATELASVNAMLLRLDKGERHPDVAATLKPRNLRNPLVSLGGYLKTHRAPKPTASGRWRVSGAFGSGHVGERTKESKSASKP